LEPRRGAGDIGAPGDFIGDGPALTAGDRVLSDSKNALISGTKTLL
jgi:hypothetical protein